MPFRRIIFLLFCISSLIGWGQNPLNHPSTLHDWAERLDVQSRLLPQEIVFVHMDNSSYFQGDTLYYKAYVLRSDGRPSDLSRVLYTELLDNDGYLIERQILKLENGQAWGSFCLADTLYCGYYELRAYTRWQLNWGSYEHDHSRYTKTWFFNEKLEQEYFRDYDKLYSRVFPLYMKPSSPGDYAQNMALRPLRRYYRTREERPTTNVSFYPEGGDWVAGFPQRIAFEACSEDGERLNGRLVVTEGEDTVTIVPTVHRGRGVVTLDGARRNRYKAWFEWGDGNREKVNLPKEKDDGVILCVEQNEDSLCLNVRSMGLPSADSLGMTVMSNGILRYRTVVTESHISIPLSVLPDGIAQITVYDRAGRVWADRITFVRHHTLPTETVRFKGIKEMYEPYEEISMSIEAGRSGSISLAIHDKALSALTNDDGTLLTELLLSSQIKGFVEQPGYYFEKDDVEHRNRLDLLLMVQGWRRYSWEKMTQPFTVMEPMEKYRILSGEVYRMDFYPKERYDPSGIDLLGWGKTTATQYINMESHRGSGPITKSGEVHYFLYNPFPPKEDREYSTEEGRNKEINYTINDQQEWKGKSELKREVLVHTEFIQPKGGIVYGEMMTEGGRFTIPLPEFEGYSLMHVAASDSSLWKKRFKKKRKGLAHHDKYPWISVDHENKLDNLPEFYVRLHFPYPRFVKPYDFYQTKERDDVGKEYSGTGDNAVEMKEVTVRTRRGGLRSFDRTKPAFKLDAYEAFNNVVDAGMHPPTYYWPVNLGLAIAADYIGEMGVKSRSYTTELRRDYAHDTHFMDSKKLYHYRQLCYLDSFYVFTDYSPRKEGDRRYRQSDQPTVTVDFHLIPDETRRVTYRDRFLLLPGYNVCTEFYQPNYDGHPLPDIPQDYRRTLYWNPNLQLDEDGCATVTFWNNCRKNTLSISAEGITADGYILTGRE